jgi:hypothetical protein
MKGDKIVAFCDRNCNVIAPFVRAPANRNESVMLKPGIEKLVHNAKLIGFNLAESIMSLDGVYNCRKNRKSIFNLKMMPNIPENKRNRKKTKRGKKVFVWRTRIDNYFSLRFHGISSATLCAL